MAFLKNTISLLAVFCVIPAAFGASPRVGVVTTTMSRMPTLRNVSVATTSNQTGLMDNAECIDAYTECIKGEDVCGSELEECTTNVLFHGKMPLCFSTLYQCSTSGINTLFGTSAIDALSNVSTTNTAGEVTRYTYPTDGSVLGQLIIGAKISNQYKDSTTCVKKYKTCVHKDSVCGEDFELCTTKKDFLKQAPMCDSVLALCPAAGVEALFGKGVYARPTKTTEMKDSSGEDNENTVNSWIDDGADLAAANAVNTCYKVVDNCFLSACGTNPYRCVENIDLSVIETADIIGSEASASIIDKIKMTGAEKFSGKQSASDVRKFFKSACIDTIGTNKYCYMTFNNGKSPKKTELTDPDSQDDLFSDAYEARKTYINTKLQTLVEDFDTKAKKSCTDAIKSCAMRSCGGGSGAACYTKVFGENGTKSINKDSVYTEIKRACEPVINTNPDCIYSAAVVSGDNAYSYSYIDNNVFTTLFGPSKIGRDGSAGGDPIGAVAALNSSLATTYNAAGIAQLKKQCENVVTNCVKSMCGTDYVNCYRSRNDIKGSVYTGNVDKFNDSMNKLGGILDYNVILGLCQNTVKNASACTEHLAIIKSSTNISKEDNIWGKTLNDSVGENWLGSEFEYEKSATLVQSTDTSGKKQCLCGETGMIGICNNEENGDQACTEPLMISKDEAYAQLATETLFTSMLAGIEREAQGLYQSKLIKQRNMCEGENNGGIVEASDMTSSTFMWAKLAGNGKVPANYSTQGLSSNQFVQTNDLYGGFCRIRVDVKSSDIYINELLGESSITVTAFTGGNDNSEKKKTYSGLQDDTVRYFAAGDAFTCGGWISMDKLEAITNKVAENAVDTATLNKQERTRGWITALGTIGGAIGGFAGMDAIQKGNGSLGGLLKNNRGVKQKDVAASCLAGVDAARNEFNKYSAENDTGKKTDYLNNAVSKANAAKRLAQQAGLDVDGISFTGYAVSGTSGSDAVYGFEKNQLRNWNNLVVLMKAVKDNCNVTTDITGIEDFLKTTPDSDGDHTASAAALMVSFESAIEESDVKNSTEDACKNALEYFKTANTNRGNLTAVVESEAVAETAAKFIDFKPEDFTKNLKALQDACTIDSDNGKKMRWINNSIGAAIGGVGLGVTSYYATRDIQELENDKTKQEAIDEWMNNIGDKIKCYIGSEEVGSYGDIVSTEL